MYNNRLLNKSSHVYYYTWHNAKRIYEKYQRNNSILAWYPHSRAFAGLGHDLVKFSEDFQLYGHVYAPLLKCIAVFVSFHYFSRDIADNLFQCVRRQTTRHILTTNSYRGGTMLEKICVFANVQKRNLSSFYSCIVNGYNRTIKCKSILCVV